MGYSQLLAAWPPHTGGTQLFCILQRFRRNTCLPHRRRPTQAQPHGVRGAAAWAEAAAEELLSPCRPAWTAHVSGACLGGLTHHQARCFFSSNCRLEANKEKFSAFKLSGEPRGTSCRGRARAACAALHTPLPPVPAAQLLSLLTHPAPGAGDAGYPLGLSAPVPHPQRGKEDMPAMPPSLPSCPDFPPQDRRRRQCWQGAACRMRPRVVQAQGGGSRSAGLAQGHRATDARQALKVEAPTILALGTFGAWRS